VKNYSLNININNFKIKIDLLKRVLLLLTFAAFTVYSSWMGALIIMVSIGFHEECHIFAMNRLGIANRGFYFLPMLGGASLATEPYKSRYDQFIVAIGGPIGGTLLAMVVMVGYFFTHSPVLAAITCFMAVVNLFNLLPFGPLDGGQIVRCIALSINRMLGRIFLITSFIVGVILLARWNIAVMMFFIFLGGADLYNELFRYDFKTTLPTTAATATIYPMPKALMTLNQIVVSALAYVMLSISLVMIMMLTIHGFDAETIKYLAGH
jgi:Zn-dependent protease